MTTIEWTDETWNPVVGCSVISPGCTNCYAMKMAARLQAMGSPIYRGLTQPSKAGPIWTGKVEESNWGQVIKPLSWKRPRRIFVNSMSDLFHESLPDEVIDQVFAVMALCPQHTFQVLTKRSKRMRAYCSERLGGHIWNVADRIACDLNLAESHPSEEYLESGARKAPWPLPNVWLGVSTEDQQRADERIPDLLATPAAVRFISAEPLLGPIDLRQMSFGGDWLDALLGERCSKRTGCLVSEDGAPALDWVIVGGESGPGARPMHPDWARALRDQCRAAGVPFFFKQWGEWVPGAERHDWEGVANDGSLRIDDPRLNVVPMSRVGKRRAGRLLDGLPHDAMPSGGA